MTSRAAAFSLVEVALALGIAAFCLVTVFGLLPVGVNTNRTTLEQATAAAAAANIAADLRATNLTNPASAQSSAYYQIAIPVAPAAAVSAANTSTLFLRADGTSASGATGNAPDAHYRATVYFTTTAQGAVGPGGTRNAIAVRTFITWPAAADANPASTPSQFSGSFEAFTTLIHN